MLLAAKQYFCHLLLGKFVVCKQPCLSEIMQWFLLECSPWHAYHLPSDQQTRTALSLHFGAGYGTHAVPWNYYRISCLKHQRRMLKAAFRPA